MLGAISNATPPQPVAQTAAIWNHKPAQPKSPAAATSGTPDTVQLSDTAQAILAALTEAKETPAQTAKEARGGDGQAQRLLAREAGAKVSAK